MSRHRSERAERICRGSSSVDRMAEARSPLASLLLPLSVLLLGASELEAHGLEVRAEREGQEIVVDAYFPDNLSPAPGLRVTVRGLDGTEVTRGQTDERGRFRFPLPRGSHTTGLRVQAGDALGHAAEVIFREPSEAAVRDDGEAPEPGEQGRERRLEWTRELRVLAGVLAIAALTLLATRIARRRRKAS